MILIDTGPLAAVFDPRDADHELCQKILGGVGDRLITTLPVLTETFHMLRPASRGANVLRVFLRNGGVVVWTLRDESLERAYDLMDEYADHPMDLADASLVAAAESLRTTTIFTLDAADFLTYRPRIGRSLRRFRLLE